MKKALITGITGQDGCFLTKLLLEKGYKVFGTIRRSSSYNNLWRLADLGLFEQVSFIPADMTDYGSLYRALQESKPDEVYNLAAQSFVQASFTMPRLSVEVDAFGVLTLLELVREFGRSIKVYQASTSEMFGNNGRETNNESSPMNPGSPYGFAKLCAYHAARMYREAYGMFVVNGILFNHESEYRGLEFVSRRITNHAAQLASGLTTEKLTLGNLSAIRDWGYAPEYVESMYLMMQESLSDDYVVCSGHGHSVEDFAKEAFEMVEKNWKDHVVVSDTQKRPLEVWHLVGNPNRVQSKIGWQHKVDFSGLVARMVQADLFRWERFKKGEAFPWDVVPTK